MEDYILSKSGDQIEKALSLAVTADQLKKGYLYNGAFYTTSAHTTLIPAESKNLYIDLTDTNAHKVYHCDGTNYYVIGGSSGDNIVQGYYYNEQFYEEAAHTTLITPDVKNLYIDITTATSYQAYSYNGTNYVLCGSDLTNYYNKTETDGLLNNKADKSTTYTKTETDGLLNGKQNTLTQTQQNAVDSGIDSTKVTQISTNENDITGIKDGASIDSFSDVETALGNKQDKVTPITAQSDFKLGKVKFDTQGHINGFAETPIQTSVDENSTNNQLVGAKCFYDNSLTFEHYNIANVLDLTNSTFRITDTTKYEAQCILKKDKSEGILFLNFYTDSSTSQSSTGWKRISLLKSTFPYRVKKITSSESKEVARNIGSIWDGSGYANLAISIYANGDIQSYYYSNILNKNGGLNICLCFPITKK